MKFKDKTSDIEMKKVVSRYSSHIDHLLNEDDKDIDEKVETEF